MTYLFYPERVIFEEKALSYPLGDELYKKFKHANIPLEILSSMRVTNLPGKTPAEKYRRAKKIVAVTVKKSLSFSSCKPSAHYQLPLATSCPGRCEYCYLQTTLGRQPYIRVYVNIDEILEAAQKYIHKRLPEITLFEASATSDPLSLEPWTQSLFKTIEFFGRQEHGLLRFVTKFNAVDTLLTAKHNNRTHVRFSLNTHHIIKTHERGTPSLEHRLEAAAKIASAGYPLGFILAPIFVYSGWEKDYEILLKNIRTNISPPKGNMDLTFELITHRFTKKAKNIILERFPQSLLEMEEEKRQFKWGQFGYGKYLYKKEDLEQLKEFFQKKISELFPEASIEYFI
ncbi:spore photoproduct lyase [Candidatus Contubernalis alkaliaceticus]|uniref:spore photoproduct lyase n=1 Tax=Candidatus Contubernalis alkaliaceticus TaxID=338645 RepID=UPI001F4C36FD|nr:spore photoproduct lyase [Candidatus Contubernalis alkalaceticus]UNC93355.1 spore photoproduct lyase [Candidatus Contubernalis alkalaceticus]